MGCGTQGQGQQFQVFSIETQMGRGGLGKIGIAHEDQT